MLDCTVQYWGWGQFYKLELTYIRLIRDCLDCPVRDGASCIDQPRVNLYLPDSPDCRQSSQGWATHTGQTRVNLSLPDLSSVSLGASCTGQARVNLSLPDLSSVSLGASCTGQTRVNLYLPDSLECRQSSEGWVPGPVETAGQESRAKELSSLVPHWHSVCGILF